jgi:hypothetical protein
MPIKPYQNSDHEQKGRNDFSMEPSDLAGGQVHNILGIAPVPGKPISFICTHVEAQARECVGHHAGERIKGDKRGQNGITSLALPPYRA